MKHKAVQPSNSNNRKDKKTDVLVELAPLDFDEPDDNEALAENKKSGESGKRVMKNQIDFAEVQVHRNQLDNEDQQRYDPRKQCHDAEDLDATAILTFNISTFIKHETA